MIHRDMAFESCCFVSFYRFSLYHLPDRVCLEVPKPQFWGREETSTLRQLCSRWGFTVMTQCHHRGFQLRSLYVCK